MAVMRGIRLAAWAVAGALLVAACTSSGPSPAPSRTSSSASSASATETGIQKIKHVVIIMQENRSFDSFFGTYPGADGIPAKNGQFTVCVPDPRTGGCDKPYHDSSLVNGGAGHGLSNAVTDIDGGKMDGFVKSAEDTVSRGCSATNPPTPVCLPSGEPDVMGYHDAREIPNYWTYASDFVLNDHMFEPVDSWSLPSHLYLVSEWSAQCGSANPDSCVNDPAQAGGGARGQLTSLPAAFTSCLRTHGVTAAEEGQPHQPESGRGDLGVPRRADPRAAPAAPRQRRRGRAARRLLVDGPDLPAAQGQRVLGLLRAAGRPARLRRQPRRDRGRAARRSPRAPGPRRSGTRCRRSPT